MPDAVSDSGNPTDEDRDRYLRLLDNARDRGLLDVEEHARKVVAIGSASSLDELNEIVWQLPVAERPTVQPKTRGSSGRQRGQTQVAPPLFTMETATPAGGANGTVLPGQSALLEPSAHAVLPPLEYDGAEGRVSWARSGGVPSGARNLRQLLNRAFCTSLLASI